MNSQISTLTFGGEFEVILPYHFTRETAARELGRRVGLTVDAHIAPSGRNWKVVNDGSVRGAGTALEFVSPHVPPLSGQTGLDQLAAVANALREMGAVVNESCGFHVHVGVRGERIDFFKNLVKLYGHFEEAIDGIMPGSRRGNVATYCKSIKLCSTAAIDRAQTVEQIALEIARASGAAGVRYHKVNLTAFRKHTTVEFRQHGGTVDASKVVNWVTTCLKLVAAAKVGKTGCAAQIARDFSQFALKTRTVIEMCSRPEGATLTEICQRGGWQRMGIKRHAEIAGFTFRKRGERYFIDTPTADAPTAVSVPATLDGLAEVIDLDAAQREFFAQRAAAFVAAAARNRR